MKKTEPLEYVRIEPDSRIEAVKVTVDLRVKTVQAVKGKKDAISGQSDKVLG